MSYKFTFADNEVYTATDVNKITQRLVTSGVEDVFADGVAYNVSKFNEAGKLLYTSGTVPESCNSLKVEKLSDSEILINPGYAFFSDGAVIEIEAGGESLPFVSGSKNYVYLLNDLINTNRCYPACSIDEPTGDFVPLAEIDENGEITDKRTYAKGKLPGYQSVAGNVLFFKEIVKTTHTTKSYASGHAEFNIGNNSYQYILFTNLIDGNDVLKNLSLYKISDGSVTSFYTYGNKNGAIVDKSGKILVYYASSHPYERHIVTVSFENGILKIDAEITSSEANRNVNVGDIVNVNLNMIFI